MRGAFIPVLVAGITPILMLALIVGGLTLGWVEWQPPVMWTVQFGTTQDVSAVDALTTYDPSVYSAGHVGESIAFHQGYPNYLFLNKYDQNGHELWSKHFGSFGAGDAILGASATADGVYLWAFLNGSSILRKYDLAGNQAWTSQIASKLGLSSASLSAGTDGAYFAGTSNPGDIAGSYSSNGSVAWTVSLGNSSGLKVSTYTNAGAYYIATATFFPPSGNLLRRYDLKGALQWTRPVNDSQCYCVPTGVSGDSSGLYVAGIVPNPDNMFLRKYDWNGNLVWKVQDSAPNGQTVQQNPTVSADSSGIYVTVNQFVVKYDSNGNCAWFVQPLRGAGLKAISTGQDGVYVGGSGEASLIKLGASSSLLLFGINPPYSFVTVAVLGGIVATSIFWLRRHWKKRTHPRSADVMRYGRPSDSRSARDSTPSEL